MLEAANCLSEVERASALPALSSTEVSVKAGPKSGKPKLIGSIVLVISLELG